MFHYFIYFYYFDLKANKLERIGKYVSKNNGNLKKVKDEAKGLVLTLVTMLGINWNPLTNAGMNSGIADDP